MMLFLGAGASKRFGIKTMEEMSREFENIINLTNDERELYLDIRNELDSNNLEEILTVSNDLAKTPDKPSAKYLKSKLDRYREFLKETIGILPHSIELTKVIGELKEKQIEEFPNLQRQQASKIMDRYTEIKKGIDDYLQFPKKVQERLEQEKILLDQNFSENLKSKIIEFIKRECNIGEKIKHDDSIKPEIENKYDRFFEILENTFSTFNIFTTNYDRVIETYIEIKGKFHEFYDGFSYSQHGIKTGIWNPGEYSKNYKIKLFKLHGSVDQYYHDDYGIIKTPNLILKAENAMIYPMREKEVYKEPFFELFTRLKECLTNNETEICIVMGYSFRDKHIQNIFNDAVKRNPKIKILLGDKNPYDVMKNLERIRDNVTPVEGEFGEEDFFKKLQKELERCRSNN